MGVSVHRQVNDGRHGPKVDLNIGVDVLLVDLTADKALAAEANFDTCLLELMDDLDIRVVATVALVGCRIGHDDVEAPLPTGCSVYRHTNVSNRSYGAEELDQIFVRDVNPQLPGKNFS